ncbi:hypothetical protein LZ30DRAFT_790614 [Colletotrichum cereale]|nr:hypothetical protein LZ30DRAFT_790614 [Colletotrichum cereale]
MGWARHAALLRPAATSQVCVFPLTQQLQALVAPKAEHTTRPKAWLDAYLLRNQRQAAWHQVQYPPTHSRNLFRVPTGMCNIATTVFPASLVIPGLCRPGLTSLVLPVPDGPCISRSPEMTKLPNGLPVALRHTHTPIPPWCTRLSHCQPQPSRAAHPHTASLHLAQARFSVPSSKLGFG